MTLLREEFCVHTAVLCTRRDPAVQNPGAEPGLGKEREKKKREKRKKRKKNRLERGKSASIPTISCRNTAGVIRWREVREGHWKQMRCMCNFPRKVKYTKECPVFPTPRPPTCLAAKLQVSQGQGKKIAIDFPVNGMADL